MKIICSVLILTRQKIFLPCETHKGNLKIKDVRFSVDLKQAYKQNPKGHYFSKANINQYSKRENQYSQFMWVLHTESSEMMSGSHEENLFVKLNNASLCNVEDLHFA